MSQDRGGIVISWQSGMALAYLVETFRHRLQLRAAEMAMFTAAGVVTIDILRQACTEILGEPWPAETFACLEARLD